MQGEKSMKNELAYNSLAMLEADRACLKGLGVIKMFHLFLKTTKSAFQNIKQN